MSVEFFSGIPNSITKLKLKSFVKMIWDFGLPMKTTYAFHVEIFHGVENRTLSVIFIMGGTKAHHTKQKEKSRPHFLLLFV